ncbi:MAG: hypothetical protein ACI8RZ_001132 [Myxococcota bacterium]|jgi:hypothetical protein
MIRPEVRPPAGVLPGEWDPPNITLDHPPPTLHREDVHPHAALLHRALTAADCARLIAAMAASGKASPVSVSGHLDGDTSLGSVRATAWAPTLAAALWKRIRPGLLGVREMTDTTPTDWYALDGRREHRRWRAVGVGPVLRFMRYESGGRHCAHYDMGFDYPDARRSLMSLVFYLTSTPPHTGGRTRLITDGQEALPMWRRVHDDWIREATNDEVALQIAPHQGSALIFDHRLCHDVEHYTGDVPRIIVRGDVIFEALDFEPLDV